MNQHINRPVVAGQTPNMIDPDKLTDAQLEELIRRQRAKKRQAKAETAAQRVEYRDAARALLRRQTSS